MSVPGWYPDPEGRPGHVRYWDGTRWGVIAPGAPERPKKPNLTGIALVSLIAAILLGMGAWAVSRALSPAAAPPAATPIPAQSDGPRPVMSPSPTAKPTVPPESSQPTLNPWESCPVLVNAGPAGEPDPTAASLGSAGLTFDVPSGWQPTTVTVSMLLLDQAAALSYPEETSWYNFAVTGLLPNDLGFYTPEVAAAAVTQCHITSVAFSGFTSYEVEASEAVSVDGRRGWRQRISASSTRAPGGGAVYEAVVLDAGVPGGFSVFWAGAVLGDAQAVSDLVTARRSLRVG